MAKFFHFARGSIILLDFVEIEVDFVAGVSKLDVANFCCFLFHNTAIYKCLIIKGIAKSTIKYWKIIR